MELKLPTCQALKCSDHVLEGAAFGEKFYLHLIAINVTIYNRLVDFKAIVIV